MKLLPPLAKKIIDEVRLIMKEDVIVVNEEAVIIASTDKTRIGDYHEGAKLVLKLREKLYISEKRALELAGAKPGINLPIFFGGKVIGVIGITGFPSEIEGYADLLRKMTELLIRETYHMEQKEWANHGLESFFYEWLITKDVDEEFVGRAELLGIPLGTPYVCVLLEVTGNDEGSGDSQVFSNNHDEVDHFLSTEIVDWVKSTIKADFLVRWGEGRFLLLKNSKGIKNHAYFRSGLVQLQKYFRNTYNMGMAIGVSKSLVQHRLDKAYSEAAKGVRVAKNTGEVTFYEDLLLEIILEEVSAQSRDEFLVRVLGEIQDDLELMTTLQAYLENNHSIKDTVQDLHIHPNTLHYRLNQIRRKTGIDSKTSEGTTLFYMALAINGALN